MAQQGGHSGEHGTGTSGHEVQAQWVLDWLHENPDQRLLLRLMFLHGRAHAWGTVLPLDYARAADSLVEFCAVAIQQHGVCNLVLSGGKTPEPLYRAIAERSDHPAIDWCCVHLFWGDERYVPHDDPRSNFRLAYEAWLRDAPIPRENWHPMPTHEADPDAAARAYEAALRAHFGDSGQYPPFDLVLLGLGEDGHLASLFPSDPALNETNRWVVASHAPTEPRQRLTLTLPVLQANRLWFLVAGESKVPMLESLFGGTPDPALPITRLGASRRHFWWLGEELYTRVLPHTQAW